MNKHIAVIVDSIDVNDSSGSKANVALISNLIAVGCRVSVFHYTRKQIEIKNAECFAIKEKRSTLLFFLSRSQRIIQRLFNVNLAKCLEPIFGFSFTFFNDVNSIKTVLKNIDISQVDLVITLSKAASFRPHYAVNELPELHEKWMAYIHDPYPFNCYPKPYDWKDPGHEIKEKFFKSLSENAKYSAFPSLLLKEFMGQVFDNFNNTGMVIPHQIINVDIKEQKPPSYFERNKFNVMHAGSLLKQRNPEGLIKGFQRFLDNNNKAKKDSKLILLGNADYHKQMIENYSKELPQLYVKLSNISFKEVYCLQYHVSVNIILEADSEVSPFLPGKFPHCVSADKPILHLGPEKSESKRLLGVKYPYSSEINDINKIAEIFERLYEEWKNNDEKLILNRPDLVNYLSENQLKTQLKKVFKND
ncbi:UDP-glycosyltransferase [Tamlana fucoidanivorans]|uniref:Glycosyltransferase family 4 protein n=1 Tax=Allotamlana fucoidanivorans TaxID=2583814 RepID=A0A5C4SNK9_9FLAO|nr:glycosyltransferase family 4 protein [Tamlana fucoidanivorans]TNJ45761.1 glycosyltransferase family 4 protein [Tamlana fucoidanivorans]